MSGQVEPEQAWRRRSDDVPGWVQEPETDEVVWMEAGFGPVHFVDPVEFVNEFEHDEDYEANEDFEDQYASPQDDYNIPDPRQGQVLGLDDLSDGYSDAALDDGFSDERHELPSYLDRVESVA